MLALNKKPNHIAMIGFPYGAKIPIFKHLCQKIWSSKPIAVADKTDKSRWRRGDVVLGY